MTDPGYNRLRKTHRLEWARGQRGPNVPADRLPHVRDLLAEGFTPTSIATAAGVSARTIELLGGTHRSVRHHTARGLHGVTRARILDTAGPDMYVPNVGAARRIQALMVNGWSWDALGEHSPPRFHARTLSPGQLIQAKTHRRVAEVYDRLWDVPGPSPVTARRATARGWVSPLAWDDDTIDDPRAHPQGAAGQVGTLTGRRAGIVEDCELIASDGGTLQAAAARLGMHQSNLSRSLYRAGRADLLAELTRQARAS